MKFSDEEIEIAKNTNILDVVTRLGYTPKRVGSTYTIKEIDSIRIYDQKTWSRFSNNTGGDTISFLMEFGNMNFQEAVNTLLEYNGIYKNMDVERRKEQAKRVGQYNYSSMVKENLEKKQFILPAQASDNRRLYAYLNKSRCLDKTTIDFFIKKGLIYEDEKHNVVFVGRDSNGVARHASKRGTYSKDGIAFKGNVTGSDKHYTFNLINKESDTLVVAEAAIDIMSYTELNKDYTSNLLAMDGVALPPLERFLKDNPQVTNIICLFDADKAGATAMEEIKRHYQSKKVVDGRDLGNMYKLAAKDVNEFLQHFKDKEKYIVAVEKRNKQLEEIQQYGYSKVEAKYLEQMFKYSDLKPTKEILEDKEFCLRSLDLLHFFNQDKKLEKAFLETEKEVFNKRFLEQWQGREKDISEEKQKRKKHISL